MLSDAKIRSLKPKERPYEVYDDRGLYMVVNPNGSRWWRFKYKYDGRERGISLGVYPELTAGAAAGSAAAARSGDRSECAAADGEDREGGHLQGDCRGVAGVAGGTAGADHDDEGAVDSGLLRLPSPGIAADRRDHGA